MLSLLALKAIGRRRISHVDDVATDPALATFAGLESLPRATAPGTSSYRLARRHQRALLGALGPAMARTGQATGTQFDLDFHAIMHYGDGVALETHYVPRRSQRTESVLTLFAQDGVTHNLVYANATCTKHTQAGEVMAFARHWGRPPASCPSCWCSTPRSPPAPACSSSTRPASASSRCAPAAPSSWPPWTRCPRARGPASPWTVPAPTATPRSTRAP